VLRRPVSAARAFTQGADRRSSALTPAEARKLARKLLGAIEGGSDPLEERRKARAVPTFGETAGFMRDHVATKRKGRTGAEYKRILDALVLPSLGAKRVVDLKQADVGRVHRKLAAHIYQANRALALVYAVWNWAARRGEVSPPYPKVKASGCPIRSTKPNQNSKHAPKPDQRRTILDPFTVAAICLLRLTGARLREILDARWDQVDLERGIMFLSDSKTGRKPLYLSPAARTVLASIARITDNPHIIAGARASAPRSDLNRPPGVVTRAADLEGVRVHDLRHSFASFGAGVSLGLPIIGKLLGHSQPATTARYAHLDADLMRRAADTIGATISAAMAGDNPQT
jgi:integrase